MTDPTNERAEQERRRWTRENAHLYVRPDAARFLRPDAQRFLRPDTKGWRHPDDKLFNPYFRYRKPDAEVSERATARLSRLRAPGTSEAPLPAPPASELLKLKSELAGLRRQLAGIRQEIAVRQAGGLPPLRESDPRWQRFIRRYRGFQQLCRKAGFDENQPRVPAGNPDGGQWSDGGGTSSGTSGGSASGGITDRRILSDATPDNNWKPGARYASNESGRGPPEPPKIPKERPPTARLRNQVIKEVAKWLMKVGARELTGPVGTLLNIAEAASWFYEAYPYVRAYTDAPKTFDELQDAVGLPSKGYDIHHIVEQTPAEKDGYPRSMIDASENRVRVPTLKHWEITGWYMTVNKDFGGVSPREYLRGKSWEERRQVGLDALLLHGVLRP